MEKKFQRMPTHHLNLGDLMKAITLQVQICKYNAIDFDVLDETKVFIDTVPYHTFQMYLYLSYSHKHRYDPNYDLLKKPASHYSQGTPHRYPEQGNFPASPNMEYSRSPQSPPTQYKRPYDTQHLTLPLNNDNQPSAYTNNAQSPYFDRARNQQVQETKQELYERQIQNKQEYERQQQSKPELYERKSQRNPFLQDTPPENPTELEKNQDRTNVQNLNIHNDYLETRNVNDINAYNREPEQRNPNEIQGYNRDVYGELNARQSRAGSTVTDKLNERRTPDAYGRSTTMSPYNAKGKIGDYEDVYGSYATEKEYGQTYAKSPNPSQARDTISISSQGQQNPQVEQPNVVNYVSISLLNPNFSLYWSTVERLNKHLICFCLMGGKVYIYHPYARHADWESQFSGRIVLLGALLPAPDGYSLVAFYDTIRA